MTVFEMRVSGTDPALVFILIFVFYSLWELDLRGTVDAVVQVVEIVKVLWRAGDAPLK